MKIIHSYWSKPTMDSVVSSEKSNGGWRQRKYHLMSWALSCLSFNRHYGQIELVTDPIGKQLLIDKLQLPYSSYSIELKKLNRYPKHLWALGKLYAYGIQKEPFIHVDGDVYIWERLGPSIEKAPLVAQHIDSKEGHYHFAMQQLQNSKVSLPSEFIEDFKVQKKFSASNAGIIGGSNIDFFKDYVQTAFKFIDKNLHKTAESVLGSSYALIYEQYLFSVLARKKNIPVRHYIEDKGDDIMGLSNFMRKYGSQKYVHLLASTKSTFESCRELELNLMVEFPDYHERIIKLLDINDS